MENSAVMSVETGFLFSGPRVEMPPSEILPVADASAVRNSRKRKGPRSTQLAARGEPYVWLMGSGLAIATLMILGLLFLVFYNGISTFWPKRIVEFTLIDGAKILGEVIRSERYQVSPSELAGMSAESRIRITASGGWSRRYLVRTGNYDLYGDDFKWVVESQIAGRALPLNVWLIERMEWGRAVGRLQKLTRDNIPLTRNSDEFYRIFSEVHGVAIDSKKKITRLQDKIGALNYALENSRLAVRKASLKYGDESTQHKAVAEAAAREESRLTKDFERLQAEIASIRSEDGRFRAYVFDAAGTLIPERPSSPVTPMLVSQIVRAYPANTLTLLKRIQVYLSRWVEFLTTEPREANTEGGVLPAIFGTFMMTLIMSLVVAPFGIIAALYLREYARQGTLVSAVRIAVNNLAGVPSIVFGVFGLGFFCYVIGGRLDMLFFPEKLPAPTFGTGGILWASLTLALLTVPVVIVATEEALAAVPRSMREGSYACGASKWQTIWRIVLPRATPGIMTGIILAMARGAGEVAPLMLTGVVKLAPELPFDSHFPFFHLNRSFMHLGFHIFDVGFQSRNSEAGKPMVFTTTLLLIALVALLNIVAIRLRSRLIKRFKVAHF